MSPADQFFVGLILFGNVVLIIGFLYCVSRIWLYWWWDSLFVRLSRLLRLDRVLRLPRASARVEELLAKQRLYGGSRTNLGYDYDEAARQLAAVANGHLSNGAGAWCGESPTPSIRTARSSRESSLHQLGVGKYGNYLAPPPVVEFANADIRPKM